MSVMNDDGAAVLPPKADTFDVTPKLGVRVAMVGTGTPKNTGMNDALIVFPIAIPYT